MDRPSGSGSAALRASAPQSTTRGTPPWRSPAPPPRTRASSHRHRATQVFERAHQIARARLARELDRLLHVRERLVRAIAATRDVRERPEDARTVLPARPGHVERLAEDALGIRVVSNLRQRLTQLAAEDEHRANL